MYLCAPKWVRKRKECVPCSLTSLVLSDLVFWPHISIVMFSVEIFFVAPLGKAFCIICGFSYVESQTEFIFKPPGHLLLNPVQDKKKINVFLYSWYLY